MNSDFTSSELIYLFLDGEHTPVERSVLFSSLANNSELQSEFEDALKIRAAAVKDASAIAPSATVTSALMSKAGFAGGAAASAVSQGWFAQLFGSWGTTMLTYVVPGLFALGGVGIGMLLSNNNSNTVAQQAPVVQTNTNSKQISSLIEQISSQEKTIETLADRNSILADRNSTLAQRVNTLSGKINNQQVVIAELRNNANKPLAFTSNTQHGTSTYNQVPKQEELTEEPTTTITRFSVPSNTASIIPSTLSTPTLDRNSVRVAVPEAIQELAVDKEWQEYKYVLTLRGISTMGLTNNQTFPDYLRSTNWYNNLSFAIGLSVPVNDYIYGVFEAGHEYLPYATYNSGVTGLGNYYESTQWIAAGLKFVGNPIKELYSIRPICQITAGASPNGLVTQVQGQLGYNLTNNIMLTGGFGYFTQQYKNYENNTQTGSKYSFNYGLSIGL